MISRILFVLILMIARAEVYAVAAMLTPDGALHASDVIAQVKVMSTTPPPDLMIEEHSGGGLTFRAKQTEHSVSHFSRIATVKVVNAVKGCAEGQILKLDFDNGFSCPNIFYSEGEECIVFLKKADGGRYTTMNFYCGKFTITDNKVSNFYLMHWPPAGSQIETESLQRVMQWLRKSIQS